MSEEITADSVSKQQPVDNSQKLILNLLGSGKSADVLLWSNKTISTDVLAAITVIWVVFRLLYGCFFSLLCYASMLGMLAQYLWSNAPSLLNRSPSEPPHIVLPDELFVNITKSVGVVINLAFGSFQDVACRGNIKQFLGVCLNTSIFFIFFASVGVMHMLANPYDSPSKPIWILLKVATPNSGTLHMRRMLG